MFFKDFYRESRDGDSELKNLSTAIWKENALRRPAKFQKLYFFWLQDNCAEGELRDKTRLYFCSIAQLSPFFGNIKPFFETATSTKSENFECFDHDERHQESWSKINGCWDMLELKSFFFQEKTLTALFRSATITPNSIRDCYNNDDRTLPPEK
jgi:hypothetical protein